MQILKLLIIKYSKRGAHEVQLTYEKVPYTLWINWFSKLCQEYTFHIKQLHIHSVDPGVVGVELIIEV